MSRRRYTHECDITRNKLSHYKRHQRASRQHAHEKIFFHSQCVTDHSLLENCKSANYYTRVKSKFAKSIKISAGLKTSVPKLAVLAVIGMGLGLALSNSLLKFAVTPSVNALIWLLVWVTLLPLALGLFSVLVPKLLMRTVLVAALVIALLAFFVNRTSWIILLAMFFILLIYFLLATHSGKKVYDNMLRFRWTHMGPYVLKPALTTLSFFVTVFYFVSIPINDPAFVKPVFTAAIKPTEAYLNLTSSGTTWNSTVRDFILNGAAARGVTPAKDAEKEKLVKDGVARLNEFLSAQFQTDITLKPDEVLNDIAFNKTEAMIKNMNPALLNGIIFILGLSVLLTLFSIFRILSTFATLFGWLLFKLLGLVKFYSIASETKEKEILKIE